MFEKIDGSKAEQMQEKQISLFKTIILEVHKEAGILFSGLGLILYEDFHGIPLSPLRSSNPEGLIFPVKGIGNIVKAIHSLNVKNSFYHDGFHLISKQIELTYVCQYFSPPIQTNVSIDYTKGGRFRAAQYGSCLQNVFATAVIGEEYGPFIFINGKSYKL
jgi:hypothetical protein